MKNYLNLIVILLLLLILAACSEEESSLTILNSTLTEAEVAVDYYTHFINPGESVTENWKISNSLFEDNEKNVYVKIKEKMFLFSEEGYVTLKAGKSYQKTIVNNAAGLRIINNSTTGTIKEVYISPASDLNWGSNRISSNIAKGEKREWNLSPGLWDVKIVNSMNYEIISYDYNYEIGKLRTIDYTGVGREPVVFRKEKGDSLSPGSGRIELVE